ncbi:carboxypeptidase-like regulatory domain-containing protein, partial [Trichloromonas sp.]|uniref:carboxypeptidase-like regulatory domain-containing protein n=1 Tax=Trichloromonas sp. TaxID=3069249 RepID=UPI003D81818C
LLAEEKVAVEGDLEILFAARDNWWGELATAQMRDFAGSGNQDIFEDVFDKPDTEYLGKKYPRDEVIYAPWAAQPFAAAGRQLKQYAGFSGKVVRGGAPVSGARVHVFREAAADFHGEGFTFSAPTDRDGRFSLHLAPGRYYLVSKKTAGGFPDASPAEGDLFGYYGGNPVTAAAGVETAINLQLLEVSTVRSEPSAEPGMTVLEGRVSGTDGPLAGVNIYLYPDAASGFRGPDLFGPQGAVPGGTDEQGYFAVDVPPGSYYLVATRRQDGQLGPLQVGDLFGFAAANPLTLDEGQRLSVRLRLVEKLRSQQARHSGDQLAGIRGTVIDAAGVVPAGVYAFAFSEPYPVGTIPPFRSMPVSADGEFLLPLAGPGTYYIGARSGYGGPPLPGEWHSFHGDAQLQRVEVGEDGSTGPVKIVVRRME